MSESVKFPKEITDLVAIDRVTRAADAEVWSVVGRREGALLRLERHVAFWDGVRVRTVLEAEWAAEQTQADADHAARLLVRNQVLDALTPLAGQSAAAALTLAQAQAFVKALVYLNGGIDPLTGRYRAPGEWLR